MNILGSVVGIFYMEILVVFSPFAWVNALLHQESCRGQRSLKRQKISPTPPPKRPVIVSEGVSSSRSRTVTPAPSDTTDESDRMSEVLSVSIGEPLNDYSIHDLPDEEN